MPPGQGYDGASNMKALVAVAKGNVDIVTFFTLENSVATIVRASCKHRDALREQLQNNHMEAFENDCLITGRGLNQETSLKLIGDTRWNSRYGTLISIISMFGSVVKVLEMIVDDSSMDNAGEENRSLGDMQSFEFVFDLFLMKSILGVTNDLSQELQKKDQEIVNAMTLVKHDIEIPSMDDGYVTQGRSRRGAQRITNFHHYHVELFVAIIDKQLVELNTCFDEWRELFPL
ncbi:uncharacterized protein LOC125479453 [Pyrus x bretschneideri]|uniref:uncharacterized protein LOC125479453 n=1 Tax=Pyrus x bretschneideri TaxID=225117 RepID=UPI00202F6C57|nr:uncharacterized protein LOC125479453 [Pyrus x bretschneideri]